MKLNSALINKNDILNITKDIYSTSETLTNKVWIDGKLIYRKVLSVGSITSTNVINIELPNEIDTLLPNLCGMLYDSAGNGYPINYNNIYNVQVDIGCFYTRTSATSKKISLKQYDNYGIASGYIIVEYTKTTD